MEEAQKRNGGSGRLCRLRPRRHPDLLGYMTDDISWQPVIGTGVAGAVFRTQAGKRPRSREFFKRCRRPEDFQQFEPREFVAQGDKVVAIGHYGRR